MSGYRSGTTTIVNANFDKLKLDLVAGLDKLIGPLKIKEWEYGPIREVLLNVRSMEELACIVGFLNKRYGWELELSWEDL